MTVRSATAKKPAKKAGGSVPTKKGFTVRSTTGLSKKRMESNASANFGVRLNIKKGDTVPVQFLQTPDDFKEYDIHSFQEGGRWNYVPCIGDGCPMCEDEDENRRKVSYRFCCSVYNLKEKKVQLVEGPKDLASRIFYRYSRGPAKFLKRTFEITKFPTTPVTYDVALAEESVVPTSRLTLIDLQGYIDEEARRFYGDEIPKASALDADDDLDEEADDLEDEDTVEDEFDEDALREELEDLPLSGLRKRARLNGAKKADYEDLDDEELIELVIKQETPEDDDEDDEEEDEDLEDDDEEDEDDDDEDEEDEEDEPPARRPTKKAPAKAVKRTASARRR